MVVAEQRPDASEEDSFQWMSRVLQVSAGSAPGHSRLGLPATRYAVFKKLCLRSREMAQWITALVAVVSPIPEWAFCPYFEVCKQILRMATVFCSRN